MASPLDSLESPQTVRSLGAESLPSPYDSTSLYTNAYAQVHGMDNGMMAKQPPSFEEGTLQTLHALGLDPSLSGYGLPFRDIAHQLHQRQTSLPVAIPGSHTLSPPYSNHQSPGSQLTLSPLGQATQSPGSQQSLSPVTSSYLGSPSPAKARPSLPTSPTHIQAMRTATHMKHGCITQQGFDFADLPPQMYTVTSLQV